MDELKTRLDEYSVALRAWLLCDSSYRDSPEFTASVDALNHFNAAAREAGTETLTELVLALANESIHAHVDAERRHRRD